MHESKGRVSLLRFPLSKRWQFCNDIQYHIYVVSCLCKGHNFLVFVQHSWKLINESNKCGKAKSFKMNREVPELKPNVHPLFLESFLNKILFERISLILFTWFYLFHIVWFCIAAPNLLAWPTFLYILHCLRTHTKTSHTIAWCEFYCSGTCIAGGRVWQ